ncbi:flagellar biosynthesis anti-sigma factor FlgM [Geothrix fermentans]|jgi:anti-sigma28 factor (negative regulator of flagellin synthesis)|uniref:flagellar biosynthesis anti-sigma factor FlgM n=1 Tax=Geothrix fermentans TaxID=44676 RepID=UPI00040BF751|nr:flagellar biosynthesis anti-sigma factor FlgM [Geothrix fermentans]
MNSSGRSRKDGGRKHLGPKGAAAEHLVEVAHEVLAETPDVRAEKLKALKRQLETGTYHPDEGAVAEGLIREHLAGGKGRGR